MAAPILVKLPFPKINGNICINNTRCFTKCLSLRQDQDVSGTTKLPDAPPPPQQTGRKKIQLPKASKRDSFTVLKALASTVPQGSNNPHYMFIDDPRLLPASRYAWGSSAMSKASGRRAAQYIIQNWPHFFQKTPMWNPDDVLPKVYYPQNTLPVHPDDTMEGLQERIEKRRPLEAYRAYQNLKDKGEKLSNDITDDVLELLCVYNSEAAPDYTDLELNFKMLAHVKDPQQMKWKESGEADMLFSEMKEPSPRAYNAMVKGLAKYNEIKKAYTLYIEMKEKGVNVELETYNALIPVLHRAAELYEGPSYDRMNELLSELKAAGHTPNLATFNALLTSLDPRSPQSAARAIHILNEMKHYGIEPCLASWYLALMAAYKERKSRDDQLLVQVLNYLETQESFEPQDFRDYRFFAQAMDACYHLRNPELADRVDAILHRGTNYQFAGDFFSQEFYYRNYLELVIREGSLENAMKLYQRMTPHIYLPKPPTLMKLMACIDKQQGFQYLRTIWLDILENKSLFEVQLLSFLIQLLGKAPQDGEFQPLAVEVGKAIMQKVRDERPARPGAKNFRRFELDGKLTGNIIELYVKNSDLESAWEALDTYLSQPEKTGFPSYRSLDRMVDLCVKEKDLTKVLPVVRLMADQSSPALARAIKRVVTNFKLDEKQQAFLDQLK